VTGGLTGTASVASRVRRVASSSSPSSAIARTRCVGGSSVGAVAVSESNPDVLYNGLPTGILNQRDNAQTGDLTAPIIAAFRAGGGSGTNNPPVFTSDPIAKPNATQGQSYSGSIASNASDPDADPLSFAKSAGPAWLSVAANGGLSGTPGSANVGLNSFTVSVSDGRGGSDTATLQFTVIAPPS